MERDVAEGDLAARRLRHENRTRRRLDLRLHREQLAEPLGSPCRLVDLTPHFAELAHGGGGEHGIEDELSKPAAGHGACEHVLGAIPQDADDAGKDEKDGKRGKPGAGLRARLCCTEGALDGARQNVHSPRAHG